MTSSEYIHRCEIPARRRLSTAESAALIRLAKKHTGSVVLKNWKVYLWGEGYSAVEFERLFPVSPDYDAGKEFSKTNPFVEVKAVFG